MAAVVRPDDRFDLGADSKPASALATMQCFPSRAEPRRLVFFVG
jgi:hypothetical protein